MAAQRIVLTSPWKLGLFVFLLVVGCGFGLIYAHLEFFGGSLDFQDENRLRVFYGVCGGVALLGLMGYLAVVSSARPLDRVVRGGKRREQLMKRLADVDDPRDMDPDEFDDDPHLRKILERWIDDSGAATTARMAIANQKQALSSLAAKVQGAAVQPQEITAEDEELAPLVNAINGYLEGVRSSTPEAPAASGDDPRYVEAWRGHAGEFGELQKQLLGFASSVAAGSEELTRRANLSRSAPAGDADLVALCERNAGRLTELKTTLESLAEESNRLAINAALQVSRLGESGGELVEVTEQIRSLSTRYQRLVADLSLCENDQAATVDAVRKDAGGGDSAGLSADAIEKLAMVLDQNAGGIQEIATGLRGTVAQLQSVFDPGAAPAAAEPSGPISVPSPVLQAGADSDADRIYDLSEFGARELPAENDAEGPVHDLAEFGAVQI